MTATESLAADDVDAYLARLGLEAEPPSVDALHRLHRAQVERVPYETVWIHMGERWGIAPTDSMRRVAHDHRGGYCFQLNGALSLLLRTLGYRVTRHVGGVHGADGPNEATMTNHLVLIVHDLPDDAGPDGDWYVDAGLGDALHEPLPLRPGEYVQGPLRFALDTTTGDGTGDGTGVGGWHLTHDPAGSFSGMSFRADEAEMAVFADRHEFLSTSPDSSFAGTVTAQLRHRDGTDILRGCVLSRVAGSRAESQTFDRRDEWLGVLDDEFGIRLDRPPGAVEALWRRVSAAHEAWILDNFISSFLLIVIVKRGFDMCNERCAEDGAEGA